jgi:dihydrolipoamide dehydrogenase
LKEESFDVVVVGAGPGGYVTAIRGAQLGLKVAVVERENLGGICLNWGCIPTKALLRSAEVYRNMKHAASYGLKAASIDVDLDEVVKRSRSIALKLQQGVGILLKKNKVAVINGTACLKGPMRLEVENGGTKTAISAKHIILATGARPSQLKGLESDGEMVWTYKEAMAQKTMPKRLMVVGAGAIGLEFACFYKELGAEVTVIEALPQVLPTADEEISSMLSTSFTNQGMKIKTSTFLKGMDKQGNTVGVSIESNGNKEKITVDRVLLAMGVTGNIEGLGLENTKVKVNRGFIQVDGWMRTEEPGIYAIGDVAGPPCLAHKASHEGVLCIEKIAGVKGVHALDRKKIPYCTYSNPQVASVGITEKQARADGREIKVGRFPYAGNGKAIALGETEGMVKTIFDAKTGELLGAHMIGAEATEMLQGFGIAMNLETTEEYLMETIFAHPTLSEMMHESVLGAYGRAIHV